MKMSSILRAVLYIAVDVGADYLMKRLNTEKPPKPKKLAADKAASRRKDNTQ